MPPATDRAVSPTEDDVMELAEAIVNRRRGPEARDHHLIAWQGLARDIAVALAEYGDQRVRETRAAAFEQAMQIVTDRVADDYLRLTLCGALRAIAAKLEDKG